MEQALFIIQSSSTMSANIDVDTGLFLHLMKNTDSMEKWNLLRK